MNPIEKVYQQVKRTNERGGHDPASNKRLRHYRSRSNNCFESSMEYNVKEADPDSESEVEQDEKPDTLYLYDSDDQSIGRKIAKSTSVRKTMHLREAIEAEETEQGKNFYAANDDVPDYPGLHDLVAIDQTRIHHLTQMWRITWRQIKSI